MARALLVGCGCRGRELGARLLAAGWQVRGTTRRPEAIAAIEATGIEAAVADPDRVQSVLDQIEGVSVIAWLLGSADGAPEQVVALHGARLERLCEEIVDTPVRGIAYEVAGSAGPAVLGEGERVLDEASRRWHIPVARIAHDPADASGWAGAAEAAVLEVIGA